MKLLAVSFFCVSPAFAAVDYTEKSDSALIEELKRDMPEGLVAVRPILVEISKRLEGKPEQEAYIFLLGLSYQDEYSESKDAALLGKAIEYYVQYLERFPRGPKAEFVRFNLAGAYADTGKVDEAIEQFKGLYSTSANAVFRSESRNRIASLYIKMGRAEEGIPLYLDTFSASVLNPELRAQAASWLLQGYLAADKPDEITPYLRYLTGRYEAIYDPAFNVTLLKAGDRLFEKGNYDQSILLYSFVKTRSEIIKFYEARINELELKVRYLSPESDQYLVVNGQLRAGEARLVAVRAIREYDVDMFWRKARVYQEAGRNWEALWAFIHLYEDYPDHEQVEDFQYTAYSEAKALKDDVLTEKLALEYLADETLQKFRNQMVLGLASHYLNARRYDELMALVNDYLKAPDDYVVAAQLINLVGSYYMSESAYVALRDYLEPYLSRFNGEEPAYEAVRYWSCLSYLLLADYPKSSEGFRGFISSYQQSSVYYEDVFYRYAIALYGEQKYTDSEAQFIKFVDVYPQSNLRGEAELYLGDLKRDRGAFEAAAEHYRKVDEFTENEAFISRAVFALSEVLEQLGEPQDAIDALKAYVEEYGVRGQLSEAYYRIGMIFDRLGRLPDRFTIHRLALEELISDGDRYAVDELVSHYAKDYARYEETFADSIALLNRLIEDPEFQVHFISDRSYQYQFMQSAEGVHVDQVLAYRLTRDRQFRAQLVVTKLKIDPATGQSIKSKSPVVTAEMVDETLRLLLTEYEAKAAEIVPYDARALFTDFVESGIASADLTMQMRAQMGLDLLVDGPTPPHFDWDDLAVAPPAVIIWEAAKHANNRPEASKDLYHIILDQHPYSNSVFDAFLALGDITFTAAEKTGDSADWEEALLYYDIITERYAMRTRDALAHLRKGQILSELGRDQAAIDLLGQVLRNPSWKGLNHAKAHLELGLAYRRQGDLKEAHGFFERLIVAYGGYAEPVSWAYYYDLLTLEALNEQESLEQLLDEYRTRSERLSATEAYQLIDQKYEL